ncbi:MAG: hypothetical protein OXJ55_06115 [Caldilineaceae bacterium]|nr:hypothetical protein [Caldilineaceae bacterium]
MSDFWDRLFQEHSVKPNISGAGKRPDFDEIRGAWKTATKAQHALLLLEESEEGFLQCQVPPQPSDRFRLGQINFTSLYPEAVVAFHLWCAAKKYDQSHWQLLEGVSWYLVFRLFSKDVNKIKHTFEGHSQSGIEFRFKPESGELEVYTQKQVVACSYLRGGLVCNNANEELIGFESYQYGDATAAIQDFVQIRPITQTATESGKWQMSTIFQPT